MQKCPGSSQWLTSSLNNYRCYFVLGNSSYTADPKVLRWSLRVCGNSHYLFLCVFILDSEFFIRRGEMLNIQFFFSGVLRKMILCSLHQDQMSLTRVKQNAFPVQLWMLSSNQHCLLSLSSAGIAVPHFCVGRWGEYQLSTGKQRHTSCTDLLAFPICTQSFQTAKCRRGKVMVLNVCIFFLWSQRLLRMIASVSKWF